MKAKITSLGKFLPDKVIKNSEFEKFLDTSDEWIVSRTGIKERRKIDAGKASSYMAIKAIEQLISHSKIDINEVDAIIVSTITPDMLFPSTACLIQNHFKIKMLIIEFHFIREKKELFIKSVKKLISNFDIVHIHANNYFELKEEDDFFEVCEITFVNKQINKHREKQRYNFPLNDLDFECFPDRKKIKFSFKERT